VRRSSAHWPPSTGYTRPTERKFYIWQDRLTRRDPVFAARRGWGIYAWRWCCTLCDPPAFGHQVRAGAQQRILNQTMPRHMFVRQAHHKHVAGRPA
jgi:hypothetical protein